MKGSTLIVLSLLGPVTFQAAAATTLEHEGITYTYIPEGGQAKGLRVEASPDGKAYSHERIEIPQSINDGWEDYPVTEIARDAFAGCENLTYLSLPEGITGFSWAIRNCPKLESVVLPASLNSLNGIENCPMLKEIDMPGTLEDISWAINDCAVTLVRLSSEKPMTILQSFNNLRLESLELDNVEMIDYRAFRNIGSLKSMRFPASIKGIGLETFSGNSFEELWFEGNCEGMPIKLDYESFADTKVERIYMNCRVKPVLWSFYPFGYGVWPDDTEEGDDYQWAYTPFTYPFMSGPQGDTPTLADLGKIRLYVPEGCREMYETDPYWENFTVEEFPFGAGIEKVSQWAEDVTVKGLSGALTVENHSDASMEVNICDCAGARKASFVVAPSAVASQPLDTGIYIVKCGSAAYKTVVH